MNNTEILVMNFYQSLDILNSEGLTIKNVAENMNLCVIYWPFTSEITEYKGVYKVFINENLNKQRQWQDFGHEMSHYFRDRGNQNMLRESFVDYCETKADYFAYHFCVPTFMLMKMKRVDAYEVMNLFNVEFDFALRRLEMYKNKLIDRRMFQWKKDTIDLIKTRQS